MATVYSNIDIRNETRRALAAEKEAGKAQCGACGWWIAGWTITLRDGSDHTSATLTVHIHRPDGGTVYHNIAI